jgi:hypothetical protein
VDSLLIPIDIQIDDVVTRNVMVYSVTIKHNRRRFSVRPLVSRKARPQSTTCVLSSTGRFHADDGARNCRDRDAAALGGTETFVKRLGTPATVPCAARPCRTIVRFLTGTEAPVPSPSLACRGNAEDCTEGLQCERRSAPEVKRQRTIGPPVPVKLLIEDVMSNGRLPRS